MHETPPARIVVAAALILCLSVAWCYAAPAFVAYYDGVFYPEGVRNRVATLNYSQLEQSRVADVERANLQRLLQDLDGVISSELRNSRPQYLANLIAAREHYVSLLSAEGPVLTLSSFADNYTTYFWILNYFFLGLALALFPPNSIRDFGWSTTLLCGAALYVGFMGTNWLRNAMLQEAGRTVFSYVNFDLSPLSFFLQEARAFGMCLILSVIWRNWSYRYQLAQREVIRWEPAAGCKEIADRAAFVVRGYRDWQIAIIITGLAFLPWTTMYWQIAYRFGDTRYYLSAIILHSYWAATWLLVSGPWHTSISKWLAIRSEIVASAFQASTGKPVNEDRIAFIREIDPVSHFQIVASAAAAAFSFVIPLAEVFL